MCRSLLAMLWLLNCLRPAVCPQVEIKETQQKPDHQTANYRHGEPDETASDEIAQEDALPVCQEMRVTVVGDMQLWPCWDAYQSKLDAIGQVIGDDRGAPRQNAGQGSQPCGLGGFRFMHDDGNEWHEPDAYAKDKPDQLPPDAARLLKMKSVGEESVIVEIKDPKHDPDEHIP